MGIKKARLKAGLTQEQLASKIGVSRSAVAMWEINNSAPTASKLLKISKILKCKIEVLLKDDE